MLIWCAMEYGNIWGNADLFEAYVEKAKDYLDKAHQHFPQNRLIKMYLGDPIVREPYTAPGHAPPWAVYQREGLERLAEIVTWWIDHRMRENGEYGGGWGDDCEMWRWWVPVLIAFDDPQITKAQAFFSNALLNRPHMRGGYTSRVSDVEHTAEDSSDAMTPMMHLKPEDPLWRKKVFALADLFENLWTGINQRGFLQFKSTFFSAEKVDLKPQRACDTVYHPRAMQPALLYWQRTGNERLGDLFSRWMNTWVDATARRERGKPAGIVPSAINWPEGYVGGLGERWWEPKNYHEDLYTWPSAMPMMLHSLLLTYHMTGHESYLNPIRSMARIRLDYLRNPPSTEPKPGSKTWCARQLSLTSVLAKYRFLTGNEEFDELLKQDQDAYYLYRVETSETLLLNELKENAQALRSNFPGYTSEVRYTDRCIRFPRFLDRCKWVKYEPPRPDPMLLYATATGDPGDALYFPLNRVRWLTEPRQIAAMVTTSGKDSFAAELFHFGKQPRDMGAELYLLEPGDYKLHLYSQGNVLEKKNVSISSQRAKFQLTLPPQMLCELRVKKMK
ncbi:hypothetical protein GF373_10750 [bacterium]|nr:hypothetical protein [bacterium]